MRRVVWHTQKDQIPKCLDLRNGQKKSGLKMTAPLLYPAQPGLIRTSVRPSVCPSVHACRLGIQWKMAQAQQIQSIIL
jgi:hypothetical protein